MAISVPPWFKLLAYTPRSTNLPKLFLESEMERALWFGLVDGKWDLVRYQLVVLWSILAVTWERCTQTCGVKNNAVPAQALATHSHSCCHSRRIDYVPRKKTIVWKCFSVQLLESSCRETVGILIFTRYCLIQSNTVFNNDSNFRARTGTLYGLCFTRRPARPISSRQRQMVLALRWLFTQAFPPSSPPLLRAGHPWKVHSMSGERVKRGRKCLANRKSFHFFQGENSLPSCPSLFRHV